MCDGWQTSACLSLKKDHSSSIQPCLNWEKWQLKSNASVYCQCLEPLFTLSTIITHVIWAGILPVAHQSDAGLGDSLERPWRGPAESELCHLSESSFNSNGMCAFSLLDLQTSGWPQWWLNSSCSERIMTSVILPLVLQGLFAVLIKGTDWWLGRSLAVWLFSTHATLFNLRCACVFLARPKGQLRWSVGAWTLLVFPHMPQIKWPSPALWL